MKPRRVIITIEAETDLPLATLRNIESIELVGIDGLPDYLFAHDGDGNRIVQVQVNAIKSEPKKARWAKFAKEDARLAAADRLKADIDKAWQAHQRKAKRAKGAK